MGIAVQLIATFILCISCVNMGIIMTWPSSTILGFKSENTTLARPMSETEISLFGSLGAIGSLIVNPVTGLVLDRFGRKNTVMMTSFMFVLAWTVIALTDQVEGIIVAMWIAGIGFSIIPEVTIYISEISQDSIRGAMTAAPMQFVSVGFLISYTLGGYLTYWSMVYTGLALSVLGVLLVACLKESPLSLVTKGHEQAAAKSIAFYRNQKISSKEVVHELVKIRRLVYTNNKDVQCLTEDEQTEPIVKTEKISCWQFFKTSPSFRRQILVVVILNIAFVLQGLPAVHVYAEPLFAEAVPSHIMSANLCSVLMGVVELIVGFIAAYLTDIVGRRPLLIYSSIFAGCCCLVLGTQILTGWGPKWMIPIMIYVYAFFYIIGTGTVPMVVIAEIFLPDVKSTMMVLAYEWLWILNFSILALFNLLITYAGLSPIFFFFAFVCLTTAVLFFYLLPETKGLDVSDIQELFLKKRQNSMRNVQIIK